MSILLEVLRLQRRKSLLHERRILLLKLALLIVAVASGALPTVPRVYVSGLLALLASVALIAVGAGRILVRLYLLYLTLIVVITPFSLLGGADLTYLLSINLYTVSTFVTLALFLSTTPGEQMEELLGDNVIVYAYRMLEISLRDLQRVIESYRARGVEISPLRPWRAVPIFITLLYLTATVRIPTLEDSLEARGWSSSR